MATEKASKQPIILCISKNNETLTTLSKDLNIILNNKYKIFTSKSGTAAVNLFNQILLNDTEIQIIITEYISYSNKKNELPALIEKKSPKTLVIVLSEDENTENILKKDINLHWIIKKPWDMAGLTLAIKQAVKSYNQSKELEKKIIELSKEKELIQLLKKAFNNKIVELEIQKDIIERKTEELTLTSLEKRLISRKVEKMSKLLTELQNSVRNNLMIRSVLHSIVNMLQVQMAIDHKEDIFINEMIDSLKKPLQTTGKKNHLVKIIDTINNDLLSLRKKTFLNLHQQMKNYIKAVQATLRGESANFRPQPTQLNNAFSMVKEKYREILENNETGQKIECSIEPHDSNLQLNVFNFSLINILENLLTNSIRKVLGTDKTHKWIKVVTGGERIDGKDYDILTWMDNGPGIEPERKLSIFAGDSDKMEAGDHGVGLASIKLTIERLGGFIKEVGKFGEGASFILGFPKVY